MKKRPKIVLRKRIQDAEMISGFEKLTKIRLPKPPIEIPVEEHMETVRWEMDMTRESSREEYKKLLDLFQKAGIDAEAHPFIPDMIRIKGRVSIETIPGFWEGYFYIQDPASFQKIRDKDALVFQFFLPRRKPFYRDEL